MRKYNCPMFARSCTHAVYKVESAVHDSTTIYNWKVLRWALVPAAVLLALALGLYASVGIADQRTQTLDKYDYSTSSSQDSSPGHVVSLEGDVILEMDGATYNVPMQATVSPANTVTEQTEPPSTPLPWLDEPIDEEEDELISASESIQTSSLSLKEKIARLSTRRPSSLHDIATLRVGKPTSLTFVDRLISSFQQSARVDGTRGVVPPSGVSLKPLVADGAAFRRRLPNGHKYGEYQAPPSRNGISAGVSSTSLPVSPTLPTTKSLHEVRITPAQANKKNESESVCRSPELPMCRGVVPWDLTALPSVPGITSAASLATALPYFEMIVDSGCSPRAKQFVCSLLEPQCQPFGQNLLPPCRKACRVIAEDCSDFIINALDLSQAFQCDIYPDLDNPEECVNLARGTGCLLNEFQCPDQTCIPKRWLCDNVRDCPLATDEANCTSCNEYQFRCDRDHRCIPIEYQCDNHVDCADGSDERGCQQTEILEGQPHSSPCPVGELRCVDSRCITLEQICDSIKDCTDGADEANCSAPYT